MSLPERRHTRPTGGAGETTTDQEDAGAGILAGKTRLTSSRERDGVNEKAKPVIVADDRTAADIEGDKNCWVTFSYSTLLIVGVVLVVVYNKWNLSGGISGDDGSSGTLKKIRLHSFEYFMTCMLGGILSGLPHTILCPMDVVKCRVQVGEYSSMSEGFSTMFQEAKADKKSVHWLIAFAILCFRGFAPTFIGYSLQGMLKFGLYELFKFYLKTMAPELTRSHEMAVWLLASACAEFVADIALCPWEAVKIKMQTTKQYPPQMSIVMPRMWAAEGSRAFFKGLPPLWGRQVPYTMVKFTVFERAVKFVYAYLVDKSSVTRGGQLVVSLGCGCFAGALCAIVSHPSDTLVSKINQRGASARQQQDEVTVNASAPTILDASSSNLGSPTTSSSGHHHPPADGHQQQQATDAIGIAKELGCSGLWRGLWVRVAFIGLLTAMQWVIYDSFKVAVGLPTTGGGSKK